VKLCDRQVVHAMFTLPDYTKLCTSPLPYRDSNLEQLGKSSIKASCYCTNTSTNNKWFEFIIIIIIITLLVCNKQVYEQVCNM